MKITTMYDIQLLMFVFVVPCVAMGLMFVFGVIGVLLEIFKCHKPNITKYVVIISGCILIAWFLYTWKSGETTEANRELINRLERDYRSLQSEVSDIRVRSNL